MNKITKNIAALIAFGTTTIGFAQVTQQKIGTNPTLINPNAALEIESTAKGLLMPRLALTATNNFTPLTAHVQGMTVYNTATAGTSPNNVTPGYYYNDGTQWVRVATGADADTTNDAWINNPTNTRIELGTKSDSTTARDTETEFVALDNGRVGIGTATPIGTLHLNNSGTEPVDLWLTPKSNSFARLYFRESGGDLGGVQAIGSTSALTTRRGDLELLSRSGDVTFWTNNAQRVVVDITGKVGIGAFFGTAPTNKLHVVDTTDPVRFVGLAAGAATDNVVVADATGVLKTVSASTLAVSEPWRIQSGTTPATTNTQNIYQTGSVAVGDFSTGASTKKMEVKGDFKAEVISGTVAYGTEVNHPLNPGSGMHYWADTSNGNQRLASANATSASLMAVTGTTTNTISAGDTQAAMASQNGTNSLSTIRTTNTGNFFMETYNVTGQYGSTMSLQNDGLRLRHTNTNGALDPFPVNNLTEILVRKAEGIQFSYRDALGGSPSGYWFPLTTGAAGQVMTQTGTGKMVWSNPASLSLANNGLTKNVTTNEIELGGTLNKTTTIATVNGATTHPLNITGLPTGVATDNIIVSSTGGQLKTIPASTFAANNIYTANGTLTANRTVTMDGKTLSFVNGTESILFNPATAGVSSQNITGANRGNLTLTGGGAIVDLYVDNSAAAQLTMRGTATSMNVGTTTGQAKPLNLVTNGLTRATVTATGEMAIGATSAPSFTVGATTIQPKLHVAGDVSTTGKYWTTNSVYADYVFEKYFKGSSDINPNYEFKSLNYVKDFIKANHHLPGVESIDELSKAENGYTFDMTKLTVQSLEKIEELYIHTIEQQDKIDQQQSEIKKLKKEAEETNIRLEKLEKLLVKQ